MIDDAKSALDRLTGLSPERKPNYLYEMVTAPWNWQMALFVVSASAVFTILGLWLWAACTLVMFVGLECILALFVPDNPAFRVWVDLQHRDTERERVRNHLWWKIEKERGYLVHTEFVEIQRHMEAYDRMCDKLMELENASVLTRTDLGRLNDATVDFLRLLCAWMMLCRRLRDSSVDTIRAEIDKINADIGNTTSSGDRRRLEQARQSLVASMERRATIPSRVASNRAQLVAMAEAFDDLYHRILTSNQTTTSGLASYLEEASARLSIEDEIAESVENELADISRVRTAHRSKQEA